MHCVPGGIFPGLPLANGRSLFQLLLALLYEVLSENARRLLDGCDGPWIFLGQRPSRKDEIESIRIFNQF